jgi:MFS family permease
MSLANLGLILSYAMAAYLIVEWPAGRLGDHALGEKELMALGFFIAACATATLSIAHAPLIWIWAIILFVSRIGAAILDIMTESYFFKQVDGGDADLVSAFRMLGPLAYIVGPIMGSALLLFTSVGNIFALLALIMLFGIPIALSLEDTR